jgi:hypothetical protein
MNDEVNDTIEGTQLSRRGLLVSGGLAAAGLTALGGPTAPRSQPVAPAASRWPS